MKVPSTSLPPHVVSAIEAVASFAVRTQGHIYLNTHPEFTLAVSVTGPGLPEVLAFHLNPEQLQAFINAIVCFLVTAESNPEYLQEVSQLLSAAGMQTNVAEIRNDIETMAKTVAKQTRHEGFIYLVNHIIEQRRRRSSE